MLEIAFEHICGGIKKGIEENDLRRFLIENSINIGQDELKIFYQIHSTVSSSKFFLSE